MRHVLKRSVGLFAAAVMLAGTATAVIAQDDGEPGASPSTPMPEDCISEPRNQAEIDAIQDSVEPTEVLPDGLPVPLGVPADEAMQATVRATVYELLACLNAGDVQRGASLFSENGLRGFLGAPAADDSAGEQAAAGTPTPRSEEQWLSLRTVTDVSVLEDGRVAAFVVLDDPLVRGPRAQTLLFVFVNEADRLVVDGVVGFSPIVPSGTPTP
jgi:hypothetical protein